jgi:hypothetical protein
MNLERAVHHEGHEENQCDVEAGYSHRVHPDDDYPITDSALNNFVFNSGFNSGDSLLNSFSESAKR